MSHQQQRKNIHSKNRENKKTDPNKSSTAVADMTMTREMEFVNVCHGYEEETEW